MVDIEKSIKVEKFINLLANGEHVSELEWENVAYTLFLVNLT